MKPSSKPISSPGRPDKFPPPLMRFLRTNAGSRSRGRTRSSPMLMLRKKNAAAAETQEPSSPKVTCMGQVRVRRSKQPARTGKPHARRRRRRCRWLRTAFFCPKLKPRPLRPVWRKWARFFKVCRREKVETSEDSVISEPYRVAGDGEHDQENGEGNDSAKEERYKEDERLARVSISSACSPPKNALLLTRCRSAPYRSSSLARFWNSEETGDENRAPNIKDAEPTSESDPSCRNSGGESRNDSEEEPRKHFLLFRESEGVIAEESPKVSAIEEWETGEGGHVVGPLILTRCKSAPSRRFGKNLKQNQKNYSSHQNKKERKKNLKELLLASKLELQMCFPEELDDLGKI